MKILDGEKFYAKVWRRFCGIIIFFFTDAFFCISVRVFFFTWRLPLPLTNLLVSGKMGDYVGTLAFSMGADWNPQQGWLAGRLLTSTKITLRALWRSAGGRARSAPTLALIEGNPPHVSPFTPVFFFVFSSHTHTHTHTPTHTHTHTHNTHPTVQHHQPKNVQPWALALHGNTRQCALAAHRRVRCHPAFYGISMVLDLPDCSSLLAPGFPLHPHDRVRG